MPSSRHNFFRDVWEISRARAAMGSGSMKYKLSFLYVNSSGLFVLFLCLRFSEGSSPALRRERSRTIRAFSQSCPSSSPKSIFYVFVQQSVRGGFRLGHRQCNKKISCLHETNQNEADPAPVLDASMKVYDFLSKFLSRFEPPASRQPDEFT